MKILWQWEDMCGPQGLQPWDDVSKDFGQCFQELCLQLPIYFIIAIVSGYYVGYRRDWVIRDKNQERVIVFRSFVVLALVFIPIIEMYVFVTRGDLVLYPVTYLSAGASCLAWLVHFVYVLALKHRLGLSSRGPNCQIVLWATVLILNVVALRTHLRAGNVSGFDIATLCCHVLYFLSLVPSSDSRPTFYSPCLVGSQHSHSEYTPLLPHLDEGVLGTAMEGVGWFSKLTFTWINPLLKKGTDNKLKDTEELFDVPPPYSCAAEGAALQRALRPRPEPYRRLAAPASPFIRTGYGATEESPPSGAAPPRAAVEGRPPRPRVSLVRALHARFALPFYSIGLLRLVADMAGFAGPVLLNRLIKFVQDDTIDQHMGYWYAAGLFLSSLVSTVCGAQFSWLMAVVGMRMRAALAYGVLARVLGLPPAWLTARLSHGELTNFMSTDAERIVNSCPSFHALWSIPLQLFITLFLLYQQVGVSFLAGVAFSVVLIPVNKVIANRIGALSAAMMRHKDERVSLVADVLRGIRAIKVHVWEDYFIDRITEARDKELVYLRGRKYLDAVCVVLWATTPVLVAALTLAVHALRVPRLDAPTVFTTVALINMLIAPLNAFPWVLNGLTEAWVSIQRIQQLLDIPDMDPEYDRINKNHDEDKVIIFKNATFTWAQASKRTTPPERSKKNKGKSTKNLRHIQRRDSTSSSEGHVSPEEAHVSPEAPFALREVSLEIGRGEVVGITGPVGSGKSSLLHALLGDMLRRAGDLQLADDINSFGYVPQKPWLVRGTIRDNILFGRPYDEAKFRSVVDACALTEDLNVLGWNAHVGEGGNALSGGQRARIALARAVYQDKQVYLVDEALAGLDARVAAHVVSRALLGLLRRTTRLMVAHDPRLLARADTVLLLRDGRVVRQGPPDLVLPHVEELVPTDTDLGEEPLRAPDVCPLPDDQDDISTNSLDDEETMSEGTVGWWVLGLYLRSVGWFLTTCILFSLILMQVSQNFTFVWLTYWVRASSSNTTTLGDVAAREHTPETSTILEHGVNVVDGAVHAIINATLGLLQPRPPLAASTASARTLEEPARTLLPNVMAAHSGRFYLEVYFGLAGLNLLFTVMRAFLFAYGGVKAASRIHKVLLDVIIRAKVKFFDVTPGGRLVNRFSSDTYTVDDSLPFILNILLAQVFSLVGAVSVALYALPWLWVAALPLAGVYWRLQRAYRRTSRHLKRLQSTALSPIYAHFANTLEGVCVIRALGAGGAWAGEFSVRVEGWQRAALCGAGAGAWLALRLGGAAGALLGAAAALAVLQRRVHAADPGLVGLALSYALSLTSMLAGALTAFTESEREMIAVERVAEYITQVECEEVDGDSPPYGWPSQGVIEFDDVYLKYSSREDAPLALSGLSFSTRPGEKLGVVGRTGAGKSSLLAALLRLAPAPLRGRVLIDGVDIATLSLRALRSRLGVIPQEPFLFGGSVRDNVDPLHVAGDAEVWRALDALGAGEAVRARGGLGAAVVGASRGLAQQLCCARALARRARVLLADEPSAHLDARTERLLLAALGPHTAILVAHRLRAALACARVLVLGAGRRLDLRAPDDALSDPASHLYALVHAAQSTQDL